MKWRWYTTPNVILYERMESFVKYFAQVPFPGAANWRENFPGRLKENCVIPWLRDLEQKPFGSVTSHTTLDNEGVRELEHYYPGHGVRESAHILIQDSVRSVPVTRLCVDFPNRMFMINCCALEQYVTYIESPWANYWYQQLDYFIRWINSSAILRRTHGGNCHWQDAESWVEHAIEQRNLKLLRILEISRIRLISQSWSPRHRITKLQQ